MRTESRWPKVGLLLLVAVCLACAVACGGKGEDKTGDAGEGEPVAKADGTPKIVAVESKFEFGKVKQGVEVEHVFKIRNEGDAELKIEKARGSWGCTATVVSADVIPPGGEGEIKAVLRTKGRSGTTKKRITVMSNDPETPNLSLELSGEIIVDVAVKPRHLSFGQVGKGESVSREFELTINEPGKVKIIGVSVSDDKFVLERTEGEPAGNSKYSIKLTDTKAIGRVTGKVEIKLEGSENDTIEVPIRATVVGDLRYSRSVYFNKRDGEYPEREVVFSRRSGKPVTVKSAEDSEGHLKVDLATPKGEKAIIKVAVKDAEKDYKKPVRGTLKVNVQDADEPVVEIRYTITDRPRSKMSGLRTRPPGAPGKPLKVSPKGKKIEVKEIGEAPAAKPE